MKWRNNPEKLLLHLLLVMGKTLTGSDFRLPCYSGTGNLSSEKDVICQFYKLL